MSGPASAVLHGVRLLGFATGADVAARSGEDLECTAEELLDQQARGRVTWTEFAGAVAARRVDDRTASCHQVWFELHEDLIATLALPRG